MPRIKILPEEVHRRIAAGEVIERPASVVKELVENALDAGATRVEVFLEKGGISRIRVRDDGEGMEPEDLRLCWQSHATSKIASTEDLLRVVTYGFRGEALFSIAQVSRLTIVSRPRGAETGHLLEVEFGEEKLFRATGAGYGTTVQVEDLFSGFPARKAFLKSPRAEAARVTEVLKMLALGKPEVDYILQHEGREALRLSSGARKSILAQILRIPEELFRERTFEKGYLRMQLILTSPEAALATSRYLYVLVNDRVVKDRGLIGALLEGLREFFPGGRYPAGVIALYLPPHLVDVNVHPAKWEVRFREERELYAFVRLSAARMFAPEVPRVERSPAEEKPSFPSATVEPSSTGFPSVAEPTPVYGVSSPLPEFRFLGFLRNTYLLFEGPQGLILLDFHAAHERLLYEELWAQWKQGRLPREKLLFPVLLELSAEGLERLEAEGELWERLGFGLRAAGPKEILVEEVPAGCGAEVAEDLRGILEEKRRDPESLVKEILARLACHQARRAGERFSPEEARYLLGRILEEGLERCPHGRPLYLLWKWDEIEREFGRSS